MCFNYNGLLAFLVILIAGCASSRPPATSGRSSTDYNAYNEDLSSVRPVYGATSNPSTKPGASVRSVPVTVPAPATPVVAPARKPEPPKANGPVEALHINHQLDLVLDTMAAQNRSVRYASGYRIQVYVGTQRQEVEGIKRLISQSFPELSPYLSYIQPTYKLKVGDFIRRLDAERYYASIRQLITSAQLQADRIDVRRSLLIK